MPPKVVDLKKGAPEDVNEGCPVCNTTRYLSPNLKLLVSPCYHKMCDNCINRIFLAGPAPCPICKQTLRKSNFVVPTFEDLYVEKEVQVRKKVGKYFNKRLEDFGGDLKKYNDYLEEVEEIMFNMINDVDVQQTNERIERFRQENKELIAANISKQMNEDKAISYRLRKEKEERQILKEAYLVQATEEKRARELEKENMLNALASSDKPAQSIVSDSISKRLNAKPIELTLKLDMDEDAMMMDDFGVGQDDGVPFDPMDGIYRDTISFPLLDAYSDPWTADITPAATAGGFSAQYTYSRAINAAFSGLLEAV